MSEFQFFPGDDAPPPEQKQPIKLPPELLGWGLAALPVLGLAWVIRRRMRRLPCKQRQLLDRVLMHFSSHDPLTVRQLLNSVVVMGRTGSGKTSSSGKTLARAILRVLGSGGLILAAKPGEDLALWQQLFREAGREPDLYVFGPKSPLRFNFLDYMQKAGYDTREITKCLTTIGETLRSTDHKGGANSDFWERENERCIYNAVEVVKTATGSVNSWDLQRFIVDHAKSVAQLKDAEWVNGYHCKLLLEAEAKAKDRIGVHDFNLAQEYWLAEMPALNDRTRSSIMTGVLGMLHVFNAGIVRDLVSTASNVSPEDTLRGKWVLVDMPPAEYGDAGNFVNAGWKYLTQRAVLRRHAQADDPINVIWCDEFQSSVNSYDAHYLAQCRSHRGCLVALTQSIHGLFAMLKGQTGEHQAEMLLTNFHHKILHALGDSRTAQWASDLVGKRRQTFIGGSTAPQQDIYGAMTGQAGYTGSFSEQLAPIIEPRAFINGLRTGGQENGLLCDAIIVRSGEPFSSGESFLPVTFSQQ